MPEPLLHDLQRHAAGQQIAAVGVPEVMHGVHYGAGTMPNWFQCSTTFSLENLKKWTSLKVIRLPDVPHGHVVTFRNNVLNRCP